MTSNNTKKDVICQNDIIKTKLTGITDILQLKNSWHTL
jgi:hypothetical protein